MNKFITKILIICFWPLVLAYAIMLMADGSTDICYLRLTTKKQSNIVTGTSRAACGIIPNVLDSIYASSGFYNKTYNFSFSLGHSPYGPTYYKAINKKLNIKEKNGIFIVTVDPWSISAEEDNANKFEENKRCLEKVNNVNVRPNVEYFIKSYSEPLVNVLKNHFAWKYNINQILSFNIDNGGWLFIKREMDSVSVESRINAHVEEFNTYLKTVKYSEERYKSLNEVIQLFKEHGEVYLVRLPVCPRISSIDDTLIANFDSIMTVTAKKYNIEYINLTSYNSKYKYIDGNHLTKASAYSVSVLIGEKILKKI
jgi:hypothetical protein